MSRLATAVDFEGLAEDSLYDNYRKYPFFSQRADWVLNLHGRLVTAGVLNTTVANTKVVVAGCGYGYLVEELLARGFDAWGFDFSAYAITKMNESVNLTTRGRVYQLDFTNNSDWASFRTTIGLRGQQKINISISEDVLPVMSDAEVVQAVGAARNVSNVVAHIISPGVNTDPSKAAPLNWKTIAEWRTLLQLPNGTCPDWVLNAEGNVEYPPDGWVEP